MLSTKLAVATLIACVAAHPGLTLFPAHSKLHIEPRQAVAANASGAAANASASTANGTGMTNGTGTTHNVDVGKGGLTYDPPTINAQVGDLIMFTFHQKNHTVTQSSFASPCTGLGTTSGSQVLNASQVTAGTAPNSVTAPSSNSSVSASQNNNSSSSSGSSGAGASSSQSSSSSSSSNDKSSNDKSNSSSSSINSSNDKSKSGAVSTSSQDLQGGLVKSPGSSDSGKSDKDRGGDSYNKSGSKGDSGRESMNCDCKCSGSSWNFDFSFDCNIDDSKSKYNSYNSKGSDKSSKDKYGADYYKSYKSSSYKTKRRDFTPRNDYGNGDSKNGQKDQNQDCRCKCSSNGGGFDYTPEKPKDCSGKSKDNKYDFSNGKSSSDKCDFKSSGSSNSYKSYDDGKGKENDSKKSGGSNYYYSKRQDYSSSPATSPAGSMASVAAPVPGMVGADSGFVPVAADVVDGFPTWTVMVTDTKPIWFFCAQATHCSAGMVGAINAPATGNTFDKYLAAAKAATSTSAWPSAPKLDGTGMSALAPVDSSKLVTNSSSNASNNGTSSTNSSSSSTSGTTSGAKVTSDVPSVGAVLVSFVALILSF